MDKTFVNRVAAVLAIILVVVPAMAARAEDGVFVPGFFDPARRTGKPDLSSLKLIRFLTDDDYPPFHFLTPDGTLTGFDVEIARAICDELKLPCTIQARRFETLVAALAGGQGDALIADLARTPENRAKMAFSAPYYRTPARFAVRASEAALKDATPETLAGKTIGVEAGSAHEAFLRRFFGRSNLKSFGDRDAMRSALRRGDIDILFGDGISLSFWLNGADAAACCRFLGGPYTESAWFGEGVGVALRKEDVLLKRAIDYALQKISEKGVYTDLYLKYFPVGFY